MLFLARRAQLHRAKREFCAGANNNGMRQVRKFRNFIGLSAGETPLARFSRNMRDVLYESGVG